MGGPSIENISNRALIAIGIGFLTLAVVIAVVVLLTPGSSAPSTPPVGAETTITDIEPTSTTQRQTTTTASRSSTTTSTSTTSTPSTGSTSTTFGVFDEVAAVRAFVDEFASAIDDGDVDFLYERLHPAVKATYDEDLCRTYIEDQILALEDYRSDGPVTGPYASQFEDFQITTYEVPVAFTFDDVDFESSASYSLTEGTVRWFAMCDQ